MRVGLYTAIYGPYDWVKPAPIGVPAYLYTDSETTAKKAASLGWFPAVVPHGIATLKGEPRITAPMLGHKYWKTHPDVAMPDFDVSFWIDGSMEIITQDYEKLCLDALDGDDWTCVPHPSRSCIYPEADYSATLHWKYDRVAILAQRDFYRTFHPPGWGLFATGANVRRHTPEVIELSHRWWDECLNWSHQDQISLPVLLRLAEGKVRWNQRMPWFQWWHLYEHGGDA